MGKNDKNENVHVEQLDNTRVRRPLLQKTFRQATPAQQIESYLKIYGVPQLPLLSADTRSKELKEEHNKEGKARLYVKDLKEVREQTQQAVLGLAALGGLAAAQYTPAAPYVNAALAVNSGINLAELYHEGTLGFNGETALNTIGVTLPGFKYIGKWRPFLPKGTPTTVYRQGNPEMLDDYIKSGMVRPIPEEVVAAKQAEALARSPKNAMFTEDMFIKDFSDDLMFNRDHPFYGNPSLFNTREYKVAIVGDMNKSSATWKPRRHKGHKYIVEPYMGDAKQVPLSEFDIYTRAPFGFGWFKNLKTGNKPVSSSIVQSQNTGELLYTPDELIKSGDFAKGKEMTAKFFEHPVVQQSYKHNQELAKRLGINLPDKPNAAQVVRRPVSVKYGTTQDNNAIAEIHRTYYGSPDEEIIMNWKAFPINELRQAVIHENLHRGWYSAPLKPKSTSIQYYNEVFKPEYAFWKWKTDKLLNDVGKADNYLSDVLSGEAGPNMIDLGRDLGLKLGLKYPGYDVVKAMLENYKGYKSFLIPRLNLDSKAGMRHVWDAMTGKYFTPTAIGIGTTSINNK